MSAENDRDVEEEFSCILAAYDDALAAGQTMEQDATHTLSNFEPELLNELYSAQACLRLLEQKWPRSSESVPNDDDQETPAGLFLFALSDLARHLGRFEIQRKLGHGGFGVVFLAFDTVLRRLVALKLPRPDIYLTQAKRQRFLKEARAAAALKHPHVIAVYDAGQAGPLCYIAEAYCEGPTLAAWLKKQTTPVDPRLAADLIATLADAVDYAHRCGIVHRDLKPSNVLLEPKQNCRTEGKDATDDEFQFVPKLTDFGMARLPETDTFQTTTAAFGGTAPYMAPEQAQGNARDVGPAADVYGLGVILYELLTGRTPFQGETAVEILNRVISDEPVSLRRLRSDVPRDLEAICLKCLEKEPGNRYSSADALATDLNRFRAGQPIQARPVGTWTRVLKWARRRRAVAALSTITILAIIGLTGGTLWHSAKLKSAFNDTAALRTEANRLQESVSQQELLAQEHERNVQQYRYVGDMRLAYTAWKNSHVAEMVELLERHYPKPGAEDLRSFVWYYLWRLCHSELHTLAGHRGDVYCVAFSPDGRRLATASKDGTARIWDVNSGEVLVTFQAPSGELNTIAFAPDGKAVATCGDDRTIRLWDTATGREQRALGGHTKDVFTIAFTPDGKTLASGGLDRIVKLWDVSTGNERATLAGHTGGIESLAFSPDGKTLATASGDQTAILWDVGTGQPRFTLRGHFIDKSQIVVLAVAFSHDGQILATAAEDQKVKLWDVATGREKATLTGHGEIVQSVAFSPDDETVAAAVKDGSIWLWDASTSQVRQTIKGHTGRTWYVAWSPDGKTLASASGDRTVKLWNPLHRQDALVISGLESPFESLAVAPDGKSMIAAFGSTLNTPSLVEWLHIDGIPVRRDLEIGKGGRVDQLAIAPSGLTSALAGQNSKVPAVTIYDIPSRRVRSTFACPLPGPDPPAVIALAYSPDSSILAAAFDKEQRLFLFDVESGRERASLTSKIWQNSTGRPMTIAFSPDGTTLAAGDGFGTLVLWSALQLNERTSVRGHEVGIRTIAFAPDSRSLASGSSDRAIKIWDAVTMQVLTTLQGHAGLINSVAYCPDGKTLASASGDGTVRLWDTSTRQEVIVWNAHSGGVTQIAFSADGRILVTGGTSATGSGEVAIWTAR